MIFLIKIFLKLILYKFLLYLLKIFQNFLFEKHFYIYNKFITLYNASSVSTEFKKLPFFYNSNDVHDEFYGDSNFFFNSKRFLSYIKDSDKLKSNLLNFKYLLVYRQYYRSLFFIKYKKNFQLINEKLCKNFENKNLFNKNNLNKITFKNVLLEKLKFFYAQKGIISYILLLVEFLCLVVINYLRNKFFFKQKKTILINFLLYSKKNEINFQNYVILRREVFENYLKHLNTLNIFRLSFYKKYNKYNFYLKLNFLSYFYLKKYCVFLTLFYLYLLNSIINFFLINYFFLFNFLIVFVKFNFFIVSFFKTVTKIIIVFIKFNILNFIKTIIIYNKNRFIYFYKIYYIIKYFFFNSFLKKFIRQRNIAYLELLGIFFSIKKDLKRRQTIMLSQLNRQKDDLKDLNIQDFSNNTFLEEPNKDFFFFKYFYNLFSNKKKNFLKYILDQNFLIYY